MDCPIEIHVEGSWKRIGSWIPHDGFETRGIAGAGRWTYEMDWVLDHLDAQWAKASLALPLTLDSTALSHWPAFLLDLLPGGPARDRWLALLGLRNGPAADWPLLLHAGRAPVGNLRLAHARQWKPEFVRGFTRQEVLDHAGHFLEFMRDAQQIQFGARNDSPFSAADTQGAAPKYLLTEDETGMWWAEGTLPDERCRKFWLVKFPRGETRIDRTILQAERSCLEIARSWGLRCQEPVHWEKDCLFVPRFDRVVQAEGVLRLGVESLCSSLGVAEFGHDFLHEELCEAIAEFSTDPVGDLLEYVARDVLNLALANSDNHARNSAFLKNGPDVRLSPLYDIAPMELDPEGIRRAVRWKGESPLRPDWSYVATVLGRWMDRDLVVDHLRALSSRVRALPESARIFQLPDGVFEHCQSRWERLAADLETAA
jgi:serine/threonine-protein kinase HipA